MEGRLYYFFGLSLWFKFLFYSATSENCQPSSKLDVVFALDNTGSMARDVPNVRSAVPKLMDTFNTRFQNARFGIMFFNDEYNGCQGVRFPNYGIRIELPITQDRDRLTTALTQYNSSFGDGFLPEDALGAMLVASKSPSIGWRPKTQDQIRVVIVFTDAAYRFPGDRTRFCDRHVRPNDGDGIYDTREEDFPSVDQTRSAIRSEGILPLFLIKSPHERVYQNLLDEFDVGGAFAFISSDSSNLADIVENSIEEISCQTTTTTRGTGEENAPVAPGLIAGGVAAGAIALAAVGTAGYVYRGKSTLDVEGEFEGEDVDADEEEKELFTNVNEEEYV